MPAIAEEAKRAEKQEIGDLVIEVLGKTIRVYEVASTTKLRQIAYSDTLQGQRFLMFSAPSKEIKPAKDFTVARLYKKPEKARKIIGKHFPKYAAAGAKVHLYYSGQGPRGRIAGIGEGYFTVKLGMGIGDSIEEAETVKANVLIDTVPGYQKGRKGSARRWQEGARRTFKNRTIRNVKIVKLTGPGEVQVGMVKLNMLWIFVYQPTTGSPTTWHAVPFGEVDQATGKLKPDPSMVLPEPRGTARFVVSPAAIARRRGKKRREKFKAKREAGESIEEVKGKLRGPTARKVKDGWIVVTTTPSGADFYLRDDPKVAMRMSGMEVTAKVFDSTAAAKAAFKIARAASKKHSILRQYLKGGRFYESIDEAKVTVLRSPSGFRLLVRVIKSGKAPEAWWWTGTKWGRSANAARLYDQKQEAQAELPNARAAAKGIGESISERFDPKAAHDYVKGLKDRKRRAYAREYLKALRGARLPPQPADYKITIQAAKEVEAGFKRLGAPLAASIMRSAPTFEQIARIVRRAKGAGFSPSRITLTERYSNAAVAPRMRRPSGPSIAADDYIFVIHHDEEDTYSVAHSVHDDPRLGYQELQVGLSQKAANRVERKLKARWKAARVRRFLQTGYGHKREWLPESFADKVKAAKSWQGPAASQKSAMALFKLRKQANNRLNNAKSDKVRLRALRDLVLLGELSPDMKKFMKRVEKRVQAESDEEKTKRIKAAVDLEIRDPKKKGLTIAQTLLAMFGRDVDEARKWGPLWTSGSGRRPWRIADQDGKLLRQPKKEGTHIAYAFASSEKALAFLKSSKGKKAATTQESIDERRFGFSKGMPMISKAKARKEIDRLGKEYKKYKSAGETEKAGETWAVMRGLARMADIDPEHVLKLAGVEEARRKVFVKKEKEEVNYRKSQEDRDGDERCGTCAFVDTPDACKRVAGKINQDFTCDLWKKGVAEDLDEALSKKARSVFSALEMNPEGLPADEIKHYGRAADIANLPSFLKKYIKKGWVEKKGELYLPTVAYWRSQGHAPWVPFAKAKALKNAAFSTVNRGLPDRRIEVILYDKKGKEVARTHATEAEAKQLPALPISWTDLMWIERHGEPSPGVKARMQEDLDEAAAKGKVQAALLDFVKKLPADSEFTLADVMRRREFHGIHFKRLMSAAKSLAKKGLIWYDGMSNVGPPKA